VTDADAPTCDPERAALFLLGALDPDAARDFARHLDTGCAVCRSELDGLGGVTASLALSVTPVAPPPGLRERVLAAARATEGRSTDARSTGLHFLGAGEGSWVTLRAGVEKKDLSAGVAGAPSIYLLRLAPGVVVRTHVHERTEDCHVIAGDLRIGDHLLHAGDHHRAEAGTEHAGLRTREGALLLIVEGRALSSAWRW
jgi:anti-sigma factor ChrR (cupin superfamily)